MASTNKGWLHVNLQKNELDVLENNRWEHRSKNQQNICISSIIKPMLGIHLDTLIGGRYHPAGWYHYSGYRYNAWLNPLISCIHTISLLSVLINFPLSQPNKQFAGSTYGSSGMHGCQPTDDLSNEWSHMPIFSETILHEMSKCGWSIVRYIQDFTHTSLYYNLSSQKAIPCQGIHPKFPQ